ncbi:MAG: hypothetical protein AAB912_01175 [Patescibacteria group bacterium]
MLFTERRPILLVLIGLAVVVVVVVIVFVVRFTGGDDKKNQENAEGTPFTAPTGDAAAPAVPPKEPDRQAAESLARFFIERIGSYSNQSDFQNVDDVKPLMTARVQTWAEGLKKQGTAGGGYRGVTTKALALEMIEWKPKQSAVMRISTQRQAQQDGAADRVYYQDAEVNVVYQGEGWLVDGVYWKAERE